MAARRYQDAARFGPQDAAEVVAFSFACPYCLGMPTFLLVEPQDVAAAASCWCGPCCRWHTVLLNELQVMRLAIEPPPHLPPAR